MTPDTLTLAISGAAYLVAALLFILSLAGLSRHESARTGLVYGITGMVIALLATIALVVQNAGSLSVILLIAALGILSVDATRILFVVPVEAKAHGSAPFSSTGEQVANF